MNARAMLLVLVACGPAVSTSESGHATADDPVGTSGGGGEATAEATAETAEAETAEAETTAQAETDGETTAADEALTARCALERDAFLGDVRASLMRTCRADDECATITSVDHYSAQYDIVVHHSDASTLDARASAYLEQCGARVHHEEIAAVRVIEAHCRDNHCTSEETTMHFEELE